MMDKISTSNLLAVDQGKAPISAKKAPKSGGAGQDDSFATDLAGAQAMATLNPQSVQGQQQPAQPIVPNANAMEGMSAQKSAESPVQAKIGPQASALGAMQRPGTGAERSPLALTSAVSMNTAAAIAGPKPWGKEWVFEGASPNSDIQPLFGAAPKAADLAEVGKGGEAAGALAQLDDLVAQMGKNMGQAVGAEGSAQALDQSAVSRLGAALEADAAAAQGQFDVAGEGDMSELVQLGGPGALLEQVGKPGQSQATRAIRTNGPVANASLSGSEYLSTLSALKGGQADQAGAQTGREGQGGDAQQGQGMNAKADLKVIEGGLKSRKAGSKSNDFVIQNGAAQAAQAGAHGSAPDMGVKPQQEVVGHVVKGAMSQDRLSTESLNGVATGIRTLSPNGGGEMKIRLNPDHLGELHVKVVTQGNQVGLQIQASDERARKILEESMNSLKTSLAAQHLTLGQVDLTVAQAPSQSSGDMQNQAQGQSQQQFGDLLGQGRGFDRNGSGSDRWSGAEDRMGSGVRGAPSALNTAAARTSTAATASRAYAQAGRLDVRA